MRPPVQTTRRLWRALYPAAARDGVPAAQFWKDLPNRATSRHRVLGLDVGNRFVGVSVSDQLNTTARPVRTVQRRVCVDPAEERAYHKWWTDYETKRRRKGGQMSPGEFKKSKPRPPRQRAVPIGKVAADLLGLIEEHRAAALLVGYPVDMQGRENEQTQETLDFMHQLREQGGVNLPVLWWDERFSTGLARNRLWAKGVRTDRADSKHLVDQEAACVILQEFLDYMGQVVSTEETDDVARVDDKESESK